MAKAWRQATFGAYSGNFNGGGTPYNAVNNIGDTILRTIISVSFEQIVFALPAASTLGAQPIGFAVGYDSTSDHNSANFTPITNPSFDWIWQGLFYPKFAPVWNGTTRDILMYGGTDTPVVSHAQRITKSPNKNAFYVAYWPQTPTATWITTVNLAVSIRTLSETH